MVPLGHAGGGDELLLVLLPMLAFMVAYRLTRGPLPEERLPAEREEA